MEEKLYKMLRLAAWEIRRCREDLIGDLLEDLSLNIIRKIKADFNIELDREKVAQDILDLVDEV
jgi:hypothetical protein